jgi:hypothetical protein
MIVSDNLTPDDAVEIMQIRALMDAARHRARALGDQLKARPNQAVILLENHKLLNVTHHLNMAIADLDMGLRGKQTPL